MPRLPCDVASSMFSFNRLLRLVRESKAIKLPTIRDLPSRSEIWSVLLLAIAVEAPLPLLILLLQAEPIGNLPMASASTTLLGAILGAQAAITALTLAVTLFVMQGISARTDADERIFAEYVRRSWIRLIFRGSLLSVAATGIVLMAEQLIGDSGTIADMVPGMPNLVLIAAAALAANLFLAGALFERSVRFANPQIWRALRNDVNERDVRQAVRIFLGRFERALVSQSEDKPDWTVMFPDPGEGSANEAIRALLDDARRTMADRRQGEFTRALGSIRELVEYAMNEMEAYGIPWGSPGTAPEWPPLRELGRNLYSFREDVITEGTREYVFELLSLDYWLVSNGVRRSIGDLVTVGLDGYRWNYEISTRVGRVETHEMLRDRLFQNLEGLTFGREPDELAPLMREVIKHQERMLSDALHADRADDYQRLHDGFSLVLSNVLQRWNLDRRPFAEADPVATILAQEYRIALMGLAGRAAIVADSAVISDATRYLNVARQVYRRPAELGDDIASALIGERHFGMSQWHDWEMQDHLPGQVVTVSAERYPLAFFAVRLMDISDDATLTLNLHGHARHVLDWFRANGDGLEPFVRVTPDASAQQRRGRAIEALQNAVVGDEIEEEREIIERELSSDRISEVVDGVNAGALASNLVERLFKRAGAFTELLEDADDIPSVRGYHLLEPKAFFMEAAGTDRTYHSPIDGEEWGRGLSRDAVHLLCQALENATPMTSPLNSRDALLRAIEEAVASLASHGNTVVVLAGDWGNIGLALHSDEAPGYEPYWQFTGQGAFLEIGRYYGHPILRGPTVGQRRLYVVDLDTWGTFVRAPFADGQDLDVRVAFISDEDAEELLQKNPSYFPDQPDCPSKLRKLQTQVDVTAVVRHGFQVNDPTRARLISPNPPPDEPST